MVLVYFVGGVTLAETSCLRYLSAKMGSSPDVIERVGIKFMVATTQLVNGNSIVDAFKDDLGNCLRPESLVENS